MCSLVIDSQTQVSQLLLLVMCWLVNIFIANRKPWVLWISLIQGGLECQRSGVSLLPAVTSAWSEWLCLPKHRIDTYTLDSCGAQNVKRNQEYVKTYWKKCALVEAASRFLKQRWVLVTTDDQVPVLKGAPLKLLMQSASKYCSILCTVGNVGGAHWNREVANQIRRDN